MASVAVALVVGGILRELFDLQSTLLLFFAAVVISAAYGGTGPAILAVILSYFAEYGLAAFGRQSAFDPVTPAYWVRSIAFLLISLFTAGLITSIRRRQARAVRDTEALLRVIQAADLRKDAFLSTVAHELRNPLAAVSNAVELSLLVGTDSQQAYEYLEIIRRQVCHMSRLIEDIMDVRRIAHGQLEQRMRPLKLQHVLNEAVEELLPILDGFHHHLDVSVPEKHVSVLGDPDRLRQVFGNILHNAAKYTPPGGRISIIASVDNGRVEVRVRDNGVGIPADMLSEIFAPFAQVEKTQSRSGGGVGIGLALVKQLVQLHAGRVEAKSEGIGKGSEFIIQLPAYDPTLHQQVVSAFRDRIAPGSPAKRRSILVADDSDEWATMLAGMLRRLGQDTVVARDGASAVDAAGAKHSEVAIVDLAMPQMDGYEVARRLRAQPSTQTMRLIALTGFEREHDRDRALRAGFDSYLTKPVTPQEFNLFLEVLADEFGEREASCSIGAS